MIHEIDSKVRPVAFTGLLRVLLVEDSEDDALLLLFELERLGYTTTYERVMTAEAMHEALARQHWDIILADYSMPSFSALLALELLHDSGLDIPFIVISGSINEASAVRALRAGAKDFIVKGNFARLGPAIERELYEASVRHGRHQADVALREAETKYRSLVEQLPAIVYVVTFGEVSQTTYISPQVQALLGYSPDEWLADPDLWKQLLHPEDVARVIAEVERADAAGEPLDLEYRLLTRDGQVRWFRNQSTLVWDEAGQRLYAHGLLLDITQRKGAEVEIQRQLAQLAALHTIDQAITGSTDVAVTLRVFADQVIRQLGVDAAAVLKIDPNDQLLHYVSGQGFRTAGLEEIPLAIGEGRPGRAAQERRLIMAPGPDGDCPPSRRSSLLQAEGFISDYGVPLIAKGEVLGVLEVLHRSLLQPNPAWFDFLNALAGQGAIALDNAAMFDGLQRSNRELISAYDATIEGWSRALDLRDRETEGHSQRVTNLTVRLAQDMLLPSREIVNIRYGALLHDIGKMGIPDGILLKPGPLTDAEWVIMRKHPQHAYELLSPIAFLRPALDIPYCHHEKWDGAGYPRGLQGEAIPLPARIFAVVDVWDALRSDRPYRRAWEADKVRDHIRRSAGTHFDPAVVAAFLQMELRDQP